MSLDARQLQKLPALPAGTKRRRHYDGGGLFLFQTRSSTAGRPDVLGWRFKFKHGGKESMLALGPYPAVSLALARDRAAEARKLLAAGKNPAVVRRAALTAEMLAAQDTFLRVGEEFLAAKGEEQAERTVRKNQWLLRAVLKRLHKIPVAELKVPTVIGACKAVELDGKRETAHRAAALATRVMRYAVATGRLERNPLEGAFRDSLKPIAAVSHPAITDPDDLSILLHAMDHYFGFASVRHALQLQALVFLRPGELRSGEWVEIQDLSGADPLWIVPARKMKMRRPHVVPLARQAVAILKQQLAISGGERWIFPGGRADGRHLSNGALSMALKSILYRREHVPHGFRSTASTLLHEQRFDPAIIELQLAHVKKDAVAAIYDRSQRLPERRAMMQAWADYLDELRTKQRATVAHFDAEMSV